MTQMILQQVSYRYRSGSPEITLLVMLVFGCCVTVIAIAKFVRNLYDDHGGSDGYREEIYTCDGMRLKGSTVTPDIYEPEDGEYVPEEDDGLAAMVSIRALEEEDGYEKR